MPASDWMPQAMPVILLLAAYLCGAIPTGYWVVKALKGIDIRTVGSGSTGATNVWRAAGKPACIFVLLCDIGKGTLPVAAGINALDNGLLSALSLPVAQWCPFMCAILALVGHSRSVFLNFGGGKSAATALGCVIAMNPLAAASSFGVFLVTVALTRYVSVGSMLAAFSSVLFTWLFGSHISYVAFCALGSTYIAVRHKANIQRLLSGTEPRIGQKSQSQSETQPAATAGNESELQASGSGASPTSTNPNESGEQ